MAILIPMQFGDIFGNTTFPKELNDRLLNHQAEMALLIIPTLVRVMADLNLLSNYT